MTLRTPTFSRPPSYFLALNVTRLPQRCESHRSCLADKGKGLDGEKAWALEGRKGERTGGRPTRALASLPEWRPHTVCHSRGMRKAVSPDGVIVGLWMASRNGSLWMGCGLS